MSEAERVAGLLSREGVAVTTAGDLFGSDVPANLVDLAAEFIASERVAVESDKYSRGIAREVRFKQGTIKYQDQQRFNATHPLLTTGLSDAVLGTMSRYAQQPLRFIAADLLYMPPNTATRAREWSHNWHRDPEDACTLKAFWYLTDVTQDAGPFEYVIGSHAGGHPELCAPGAYAPAGAVEGGNATRAVFICPKDSIVFADTSGIHRGGYTRGVARCSAVWTFVPVGSGAARLFSLDGVPRNLSAAGRIALDVGACADADEYRRDLAGGVAVHN